MTREELETIEAMSVMGGHFVRGLASLYTVANTENRRVIRETWPDIWAEYSALAKKEVGDE